MSDSGLRFYSAGVLEFSVAGSTGAGDNIADIGHAGHEQYQTLESEADS